MPVSGGSAWTVSQGPRGGVKTLSDLCMLLQNCEPFCVHRVEVDMCNDVPVPFLLRIEGLHSRRVLQEVLLCGKLLYI